MYESVSALVSDAYLLQGERVSVTLSNDSRKHQQELRRLQHRSIHTLPKRQPVLYQTRAGQTHSPRRMQKLPEIL